jgi:Zn-dependent M28 family amino/carboxypeptidase
MKIYLLLPLLLSLGCNAVKNSNLPVHADQLLKDTKTLSSDNFEGRKTGTKGGEMARNYIARRFRDIGIKSFPLLNSYQQTFSFSGIDDPKVSGKNLIGYIAGRSDKVIVISAHYDHLGVINGKIYNGADDNASGGSAYFVDNLPIDIKRIKLNINLDMISHNDKGELYASGTFKNPQLKNYIHTDVPDIKILFGHDNPKLGIDDWTNQSDQSAFNARNIPFIYFGIEDHRDYHKDSDKFENINQSFFVNAANAILEITDRIDANMIMDASVRDKTIMNKR